MSAKHLSADFNDLVKRADLFAEQAMVATIGFKGDGAAQTMSDFIAFLEDRNIAHQVLSRQDNRLTFVVAREKDLEAEFIRGQVAGFFSGARKDAKDFEGYYQKFNSAREMEEALPRPLDKDRRAVRQLVQKLHS
jgi:hypothetical protein